MTCRTKARAAASEGAKIEARITQLTEVRTPGGVPDLAQTIGNAQREHEATAQAHSAAVIERQRRQDELSALPAEVDLQLRLKRHDDLLRAGQEQDEAESGLQDSAEGVLKEAQAEASARRRQRSPRRNDLAGPWKTRHRAYHLASTLAAGDACPVCLQHVTEPPVLEEPDEMREIDASLDSAQRDSKTAAKKLADAQSSVDRLGGSFENATRQVQELRDASRDDLSRDDLAASLEQVTTAGNALKQATSTEDSSRLRLKETETGVKALDEEQGNAWLTYSEQRDLLAEMRPPGAERDDLAAAWAHLVAWATEQAKQQRALLAQAKQEQGSAEAALGDLDEAVSGWCVDAGVDVATDEEPMAACSREMGQQQAAVERIQTELTDLEQRRRDVALLRRDAAVAQGLAEHLRTSRFEGWLMGQVLEQICVGASKDLRKLSNDAYSLSLNERYDFVVVDHHNADERRPVKTLSGGETFLASLSLALSLSTQIVDFAVGGTAKLEALFLDEGFGTLDPDTLDMVTDAIEELGSDGRMVGVVTHVPELAAHMPVRFEVIKQGNRSSIERVEA